ncbi:uncharacterized protein LOC127360709 [Dicentrarchus labrax]|uniref:uncharacterized protein LOC127360709 n=1 Tax=Dicentrarchus labrax TaxID=13489 RepID=UPI0021F514D1|nr:uncharacterized protein LOC127360709 [Dicentrarchus labrax]
MEVTSLCFRVLSVSFYIFLYTEASMADIQLSSFVYSVIFDFILLGTQVQNHYTQGSGPAFLRITPNRLQHFQFESVSFHCEGTDGSIQLKGISNTEELNNLTIDRAYPEDSGEYWCETNGGKTSNRVNITVTAGSVILDSPALPVLEGDNATLHCRNKTISNLLSDFYKDDLLIESSSTGEMTILNVSKADEGLYKCRLSGGETSPGSWLAVRELHIEAYICTDHFLLILLLRTVLTIVMVALLLLLVGLLHCGKLKVTHRYVCIFSE